MTSEDDTGSSVVRPNVYLEIDPGDLAGWRYRVLLGITEVSSGWRPTRRWAIAAGRRRRDPYLTNTVQ